ncbi:MAG: hypothetical protein QM664_12695, partial [Flavihumibacter sp.]
KKLPQYLPLFIYAVLSFCNEAWSDIAISGLHRYQWSRPTNNIYDLCEVLLWLWQFKNWGLFADRLWLYRLLLGFRIVSWILLVVFGIGMGAVTSWSEVMGYFMIAVLAISNLNFIFARNRADFSKSTNFIATIACIFFFCYKVCHQVFFIYGLDKDMQFVRNVYSIFLVINIIYNLLLAYGLLWTDRKQPYLLRY